MSIEKNTNHFTREPRYVAIKITDAKSALTQAEITILNTITAKVEQWRHTHGKTSLQGVFVEHDWPEYDPTWAAIEKRMTA